jgi:S1-C subfamily serine protease
MEAATVLRTRDGSVQISLPPNWVERIPPEEQRGAIGEIFARDPDAGAYLRLTAQRGPAGFPFKSYAEAVRQTVIKQFTGARVSEAFELVINGHRAIRYEIIGSKDGSGASYQVTGYQSTSLELEKRFVTLTVWTVATAFNQRRAEFAAFASHVTEPVETAQTTRPALVTGTGFVLSREGHVITNNHVVNDCVDQIYGALPAKPGLKLRIIARDPKNDVALLMATTRFSKTVAFRGAGIRPGDAVIAIGYPLFGTLSSEPIVTTGIVSALGGLQDDSRFIQISASVQPGNSGGPLLDMAGNVVGVVTQKIDPFYVARTTGSLPENVNFALKTGVVRDFLEKSAVAYPVASARGGELTVPEIAARAKEYTLLIWCKAAIHE